MKKNRLFVYILLISGLFMLNLFIQPLANPNISQISNITVKTTAINGEFQLYHHFTLAGDFGNWKPTYYMGADFIYFDNTGPSLVLKIGDGDTGIEEGYALNNLPDTSTNEIRNYSLRFKMNWGDIGSDTWFKAWAVYTDSTNDTLFSQILPGGFQKGDITWKNGTFTTEKTLDYMLILVHVKTADPITISLLDELYFGYSPNITFYETISGALNLNTPYYFYLVSSNAYSAALIVQSIETGGYKTEELERDWVYSTLFFKDVIFTRTGMFSCFYVARNAWGVSTLTPPFTVYTYEYPFPKISYLNVRSYEYRDIPEELFYVYLGDSESIVLFDFKTLFGNWKIMGSCIWAFGNERIMFNCTNGGIKSDFSHIAPGRQYDLQNLTLEFDLKTSRDRLVIIVNPTQYDYDYLLLLNETYQDKWVTVRIPFYMFQSFPGHSDYIGELGFYSNYGYYELANIKICNYYFSTVLVNSTAETYTATLGNQENIFATNFNYTNHFQSENVTIVSNETLQLKYIEKEHTGHYSGLYSFTYDADGSNPSGWTISEPGGITVDVYGESDNHKKVVKVIDYSITTLWRMSQLFDAGGQERGGIEFWARAGNDENLLIELRTGIESGAWIDLAFSNTHANYLQYYDGSWHDIVEVTPNTWYHIMVTFECKDGGFDGLSSDKFNIYVNGDKYGQYSFFYYGDTIGWLSFDNYPSVEQCDHVFIDAIDYSWAEGYYINRNMNDTAGYEGYAESGYYISPSYDLGEINYYYYQNLDFNQEIQSDTNLTLQYRTSIDNISWSEWNSIIENITVNQFDDRYFQFAANFTSANSSCTAALFWLNFSYSLSEKNFKYCYINITNAIDLSIYEELSFWYNFSNSEGFLYLQFYDTSWHNITQLNSTELNYGLGNNSVTTRFNQYWRNITLDNAYSQIRLYFAIMNLTSEDDTLQIKRFECINLSIYRLESEMNRQRYDILIFQREPQTLLLIDFAGREIYRQEINYSAYIDIYLNIAEITLINYLNITAWFAFESRGVSLVYGVAAGSQRNILMLLDDYWVKISTDNLTILDVRQISVTSTNKTTVQIGVIPVEPLPEPQKNLLELLWQAICIIFLWFFTNPWGILVFCLLLLYLFYRIYKRFKKRNEKLIQAYKKGYTDGLANRRKLSDEEILNEPIFIGGY